MDNQQKKTYRTSQWYSLRDRIIARDGYCCARCKRTADEVVLQVHHINYLNDRKAWEYPEQELITMCKGCHAQEHGHIRPTSGWEYIGEEDLGSVCENCEICGSSLRYAHTIFHEKWGTLIVGADCADQLTGTNEASEYEEKRKKLANRLRTYLVSPLWKHRKNGYFRELDGYFIKIWEHQVYFNIEIHYSKKEENGDIKQRKLSSKVKYPTLEEAKTKAFEVITNGELAEYIKKNN